MNLKENMEGCMGKCGGKKGREKCNQNIISETNNNKKKTYNTYKSMKK